MRFSDVGYIIKMKKHGENSLILTVLSRDHGKVTGYVKNALSKKKNAIFQLGNKVQIDAYARVEENMLSFKVELDTPYAANFITDNNKLNVLSSFCTLSERCLPEMDNLEKLYKRVENFFNFIDEDNWITHYSYFEFYLLEYLGIGLDLSECSATGTTHDLAYVSPKSGKAVCAKAGEPYKDRLFKYPHYILQESYNPPLEDVRDVLKMTAFFLNKNFFATHSLKFPVCRANLAQII